ncbi:S8 family serine peptidase [Hymenobacter perfusus]|uniref:T9SS C-terminal target domain-containing protein n=1 Tax=Hymenobacter perfusus TaxID=1236770 RepID=A0A3R9NXV5_9BACT|nr:S8 family serine peptidase [Hymenobacter perfusus]RSK45882.1 T9SS C-terminal target domain-containing protein [Hymenobacter perfusus]
MSAVLFRRIGLPVLLLLLWGEPGQSNGQVQVTRLPGRLAPGLEKDKSQRWLRVSVTDETACRQWLKQHYPNALVQPEAQQARLRVRGVAAAALATCPWVSFVQAADRQARPERQLNGADFTLNKVTTVHARYPRITGQGLTVSVKESPLDILDIDFKGRLLNPDPQAQLLNSHSTIMTTLIAGGGNSSPNGKGAAWKARIAQSSYDNLFPDNGPGLAAQGVSVQNHSYGVAVESFYGQEARAYDQQVRQYPTLLHVFSAGNSGNQGGAAGPYAGLATIGNLTGEFKNSKNSLSVGNTDALGQVAPLSSRGPAADGRVKPELVAFGDGGASDAAALVSGVSLLAQHAYKDRYGTLPSAALVKAVLLNTADDTGRPNVDFVAGYGQVDALGAVQTMLEGRFQEGTIMQGERQSISIPVPAGTHRLKITLAWTDPAAVENAPTTLVNDLDMRLSDLNDTQTWHPWTLSSFPHLDSLALPARRRPNHRDNVEQITVDAPAANGYYILMINGFQVTQGPQAYSIAYEFESDLTWVHPSEARNLRAAESALLRWQWAGPAASARLEYRPVGQAGWNIVNPALDLSSQTFRWTAPDVTEAAQLRLTTGASVVVSDTFFVARPLILAVGYTCPEETLLTWPRIPGATQYQVYALGSTHMEPYRLLTDTALVLTAAEAAAQYFAVAPVIQQRVGERSGTVNVLQESNGCYIRSFLARQLVTDTVEFDLTLGTTFRLQTVTLERRAADGSFVAVQSLAPDARTTLRLLDPTAVPGRSEYRVRLQLATGRLVYSSLEEIYLVPSAAEVLVFPVPVAAGEPLTVVGPPDQVLRVRVFDLAGRLRLNVVSDTGTIKTLDTHGLNPGVYLLRISTPGGREVTRRVIVL